MMVKFRKCLNNGLSSEDVDKVDQGNFVKNRSQKVLRGSKPNFPKEKESVIFF